MEARLHYSSTRLPTVRQADLAAEKGTSRQNVRNAISTGQLDTTTDSRGRVVVIRNKRCEVWMEKRRDREGGQKAKTDLYRQKGEDT